jgi:uncharacterized protein (DUF305 family)
MRRAVPVLVAAAALGLPSTSAAHGVGPANVSVHTAPFDLQFIDMMAMHHQMQIEMGMMALRRAARPELKQFARRVVADQRKERRQLSKLRASWYGSGRFQEWPLSEAMMRMMGIGPKTMEGLMMTGRFDYAWISAVMPHHAAAITMSRWETQAGEKRILRLLAKSIIRKQAREIGDLIEMRQAWYT